MSLEEARAEFDLREKIKELEAREQELDRRQAEIEQQEASLQEKAQQTEIARSRTESDVARRTDQADAIHERVGTLERAITNKDSHIAELRKRLSLSESDAKRTEDALRKAQAAANQIPGMEQQTREMGEALRVRDSRLTQADAEIARLQASLQRQSDLIPRLENRLRESDKTMLARDGELATLKEQHRTLRDVMEERSSHLAGLRDANKALTEEREMLARGVQSREASLREAMRRIEELERETRVSRRF